MPDLLSIHKALADETRLRLMRLLARSPLNVNELIDVLRMGQSRVSRHLRILAEVGLVMRRREGTWSYYERTPSPAEPLVSDTLRQLAEYERMLPHFEADLQRMESVLERRRQQTRRFFDSRSGEDELRHGSLEAAFYRNVALSLLPPTCTTILDLGTGSGLLLPALLERAEQVIAVDASSTMLALARSATGDAAARCDLRLGDLEHLPVADGEVDAVLACMVLHHVSTPQRALTEARRALRPGGQLVIVDLDRHDDESLRELADLWLGFDRELVQQWLTEAGFAVAQSGTVSAGDDGDESVDDESLRLITFQAVAQERVQAARSRRSARRAAVEAG